ncbi:hypothetical protein ACVRXQ_05725 [Streptococcus panodentis]|nr:MULTISPECIES: hypothetical protein [Streptococcus]KXT84972.1 Response regulator of the competence regulon ComE [Streptococcus sp. DD11]
MKITILEDSAVHRVRLETAIRKGMAELGVAARILATGKIMEFEASLGRDTSHHLYFLDLDIQGERNKGFEVAQLIRRYNPHAIIVFMTDVPEVSPLAFQYHVSALDFIDKDGADYDKRVKECLEYTARQLRIIDQKGGSSLL